MQRTWILRIFAALVFLTLLTPLWVFTQLFFPFVTSKAFYLRIVIELAFPLYVVLLATSPKLRPSFRNLLNVSALGFLVISFISGLLGEHVARSLWGNFERMGGVYYLAHLVALYFYIQMLGQAGGTYLKRFLQAFIGMGLLVTLNGLSGWIGGPTFTTDPSLPVRVSSTFGNPIFFASFLIIPMFLSAYFALQEENRGLKIMYWIFAALQLLGIYSSGTRGAVVGILAGLLVGAIVFFVKTPSTKVKRYGLIVLAVLILAAGTAFMFRSRLPAGSTLSRIVNLNDSNTSARLIQWRVAMLGVKDNVLLGTGSENYYVVANKYYDPEIYQYDPSWFDKPHNYLLEILVTNGVLGFAAYMAMLFGGIYFLYRSYKHGLVGLLEFSVLLAGFITYQVQNLTVFDTVSASLAFFAFLGFVAYLGHESIGRKPAETFKITADAPTYAVLVAGLAVVCYLVYASNVVPMWVSKRVNFGNLYAPVDSVKAAEYFQSAIDLPFNIDKTETANRYSDFAFRLPQTSTADTNPSFVATQVEKATAYQRAVTEQIKNDPLLWLRLANDELILSLVQGKTLNESNEIPIRTALSLAPHRVELMQFLLQLRGYQSDWSGAVSVAKEMVETNPYRSELKWQLAIAYKLAGQLEDAVKVGNEAIDQGYKFKNITDFSWFIEYYEQRSDYARLVALFQQAQKFEPNNLELYIELAKAYAGVGDKIQAKLVAEEVKAVDSSKKTEMDAFIRTLQ